MLTKAIMPSSSSSSSILATTATATATVMTPPKDKCITTTRRRMTSAANDNDNDEHNSNHSDNNNNNNNADCIIPPLLHNEQQQQQAATVTLSSAAASGVVSPSSSNLVSSALVPVSLLGGTAAVYYSAVVGRTSSLTPLSAVYMILLAVQYAVQPRLTRRYVPASSNKRAVALAEEVVKTAAAAVLFRCTRPAAVRREILTAWSLRDSLQVAGVPAAVYAVQGVLQYASQQHLDAVAYNGLSQTKTLWAAASCWMILGQVQSTKQLLALLLLTVSALLFQSNPKEEKMGSAGGFLSNVLSKLLFKSEKNTTTTTAEAEEAVTGSTATTTATTATTASSSVWFWQGVVPCLAATFCSGLAGALSQAGLQLAGGTGRDPFFFTVEISAFSAITLLFSMAFSAQPLQKFLRLSSSRQQQQQQQQQCSSDNDTTGSPTTSTATATTTTSQKTAATTTLSSSVSWIVPVLCKAAGGVLTALVHKYAGSVAKGFALLSGLVLSALAQAALTNEQLSAQQVLGTILVMAASKMHFGG